MLIKLSPIRSDVELTVFKHGDSLTINGLTLDFTQMPVDSSIPASATGCEWLIDQVQRVDGRLTVTLVLPHGPDAPEEARFPSNIVEPANGKVALPIPDAMQPSPSQGYAVIDWSQLVTAEDKAALMEEQLLLSVTTEIAKRRSVADSIIAPLQDALDLDEATDAEVELLKAWKRYRVALNRLPEQPAWPTSIDWPAAPA